MKLKIKNETIKEYTEHEINNFKGGKIKIARNTKDILNFVNTSIKVQGNAKLYFGKIGTYTANKIKKDIGIDIENYNISLQGNAIRHIFKNHGDRIYEQKRGQLAITKDDFKFIPLIISKYDIVKFSGKTENNNISITFQKKLENNYYLVSYTSIKNHNIEVKTIWKTKAK
ncbi:MAG: hypothetical protein NC483_06180 [Ruminococcus sp.]|nr:hypothetical protein [Ruminococcus sp.]